MTDSHAHMTMNPLVDYTLSHLSSFKEEGGKYIVNVAYTPETLVEVINQQNEFESKFPNMLIPTAGIHPEYLSESKESDDRLFSLISSHIQDYKSKIKVIGECGLDYYHLQYIKDRTEQEFEQLKERQKRLFHHHLKLAIDFKLPLTIHTRDQEKNPRCTYEALKLISMAGNGNVRGSFHSYTGDLSNLEEILNLGFYVGFNGIVTYPRAENVREILRKTPLDRILLETDAPLLPPQNVRNGKSGSIKYGTPKDVFEIAKTIAIVKEISVEKVLEITTDNFTALFLRN